MRCSQSRVCAPKPQAPSSRRVLRYTVSHGRSVQYSYLHEFDDIGQAWLREDFCERLRRAHACGKDGKGTEGEI